MCPLYHSSTNPAPFPLGRGCDHPLGVGGIPGLLRSLPHGDLSLWRNQVFQVKRVNQAGLAPDSSPGLGTELLVLTPGENSLECRLAKNDIQLG